MRYGFICIAIISNSFYMNCLGISRRVITSKSSPALAATRFGKVWLKPEVIPPMLVKLFDLRLSAAEKLVQLIEAGVPTADDAHRLVLLPLLN